MIRVTEASFARQVLRAPLPTLLACGTRACPGLQALRPGLARLSEVYRDRIAVALLVLDQASLLADQYGLTASPTLMVFAHGDRLGQAIGFLPAGLLELLADDVLAGVLAGDRLWSPVEERFEEAVLLPHLQRCGLWIQRQVACPLPGRNAAQRGRIDLLVSERQGDPPFTLIESKRQIHSGIELQAAAAQGAAYARSLGLRVFLVAAPQGLWLFQAADGRLSCVRQLSSLELHRAPDALGMMLERLR